MLNLHRLLPLALATLAAASASFTARADVTVQQQSTFDLTIIKAHSTTTETTTADKQRRDTEFHCEGFMSLLCGNAQSGEILRLDKDVRWSLDPKKKEYRESPFPTAAQRQQAENQMRETMEKLKQCPAAQNTAAPAPDTSKCDMTPPVFDIKTTDKHATFIGHDARLTQMSMTQSCKAKDSADVCQYVIALDTWLTQDPIAGLDEEHAFASAYVKKLGLDKQSELVQTQMKQFLAPYQDSLKQLAGKSADLKGYPLKTTIRIAFGGEHCAAAKEQNAQAPAAGGGAVVDAGQAAGDAATSATAGAAGSAAGTAAASAAGNGVGGSILGSAANTFGSKLVGGLFAKKKTDAPASAPAAAAPDSSALPPGMVQAAQFSVETTSITNAAVPAGDFDIPPGWRLVTPKEHPAKEFSCPKGSL